jgi:hypothetical protein
MKAATIIMRAFAWMIIAMFVITTEIPAQDAGETEEAYRFKKEELTQMLAPIALYPDSLIAQILMASTYPLEVVEAERWLRQNKELKGNALDEALKEKTWDPSVKSLCHFPDVLFAMSNKLDQTRKLGDAFLGQEDEVMATIQDLRLKAQEQGNLKTTEEQKVIVEREIVRIEPAYPEVVYVPVYDPMYMARGGILLILLITGIIRPVLLSLEVLSGLDLVFLSEPAYSHGSGSTGMYVTSI